MLLILLITWLVAYSFVLLKADNKVKDSKNILADNNSTASGIKLNSEYSLKPGKNITNISINVKDNKNSILRYTLGTANKTLNAQMELDYRDITSKFADFNSDGIEDLVVVSPSGVHGTKAYVFISNIDGSLKQYCANKNVYQSDKCAYFSDVSFEDGRSSVGIKDMNGDNLPELITRNSEINGELHYNLYSWDKLSKEFLPANLNY